MTRHVDEAGEAGLAAKALVGAGLAAFAVGAVVGSPRERDPDTDDREPPTLEAGHDG